MKRVFAMLLTLAMIFATASGCSSTESKKSEKEDVFIDDGGPTPIEKFDYNIEDGTIIIYKARDKSMRVIRIAEEYDGYAVTTILHGALLKCEVEILEIPGGVKKIGEFSFPDLLNLKKVVFSDGVEILENYMFAGCIHLEIVEIPASVTNIGEKLLFNCGNPTIRTPEGSYAHQWAQENGIPVETY